MPIFQGNRSNPESIYVEGDSLGWVYIGMKLVWQKKKRWTKNLDDSVLLSDDKTTQSTIEKIITDLVNLSDDKATGIEKVIADTITLSDDRSTLSTFNKDISDAIGLSDDKAFDGGLLGDAADTVTITDDRTVQSDMNKDISDSITVSDDRTSGINKEISDTINLSDDRTGQSGISKDISDTVILSDEKNPGVNKEISDSVNLSDDKTIQSGIDRTITDTINLSDDKITSVGIVKDISDSVTLSDEQSEFTHPKYGLLYNWYASMDSRNMAPSGWHVATSADYSAIRTAIDPDGNDIVNDAGNHMKESGTVYWITDQGTNDFGFYARGAGDRSTMGAFSSLRDILQLWTPAEGPTPSNGVIWVITDYRSWFSGGETPKYKGASVRWVKDNSTDPGKVTGNDGNTYHTVKIGNIVITACNVIETKYRNGDTIPEVTDNTTWGGLTSGALCAYNNDWNNV